MMDYSWLMENSKFGHLHPYYSLLPDPCLNLNNPLGCLDKTPNSQLPTIP
jgi:hypothetical protein